MNSRASPLRSGGVGRTNAGGYVGMTAYMCVRTASVKRYVDVVMGREGRGGNIERWVSLCLRLHKQYSCWIISESADLT